ncbi:MAG TPA: hypothetical protein VFG74_14210, partial [Miltoncostaeaceae bacterium]|nr:hypothetical protein [Miltoncostaeaceae bacterium]
GAARGKVGVRVARYADISGPGDPMATAPADGSTLAVQPRLVPDGWRLAAASTGSVVVCSAG